MNESPVAKIAPLKTKRDWLEDNGAYSCLPFSLPNKLGFGIYFEEDIEFILHSKNKEVEVFKGKKIFDVDRKQGTISFSTNLNFHTEDGIDLITMGVPNQFFSGAQCITSIINSSMFTGGLSIVWKITDFDKIIKIPSGTFIASVLPINLSELNNSVLNVYSNVKDYKRNNWVHGTDEYHDAMFDFIENNEGKPTNWYRDAVNHQGEIIGKHSVTSLNFKVNYE